MQKTVWIPDELFMEVRSYNLKLNYSKLLQAAIKQCLKQEKLQRRSDRKSV
jgi:post-segregation antitoxin (ccd killing protein)